MSSKKYDLVILPGRFEPFHDGHHENTKRALELGEHVLFLIGSAYQPRTIKNPLNADERAYLIEQVFSERTVAFGETVTTPHPAIGTRPVEDFIYSDSRWVREVQHQVNDYCEAVGITGSLKIAIMGHEKDESSYYLRKFPMWAFEATPGYKKVGDKVIDATKIRELMFEGHLGFIESVVHPVVYEYLIGFTKRDTYQHLVEEYEANKAYKQSWEAAPFPPTFNTVDAVVVQGGHVALVQRKNAPGKNLWALPGGFLQGSDIHSDGFLQEKAETFREGCLRELCEETRIKVPKKILDANITYQHCFDHPDRSLRGRTITQAFLIELPGDVSGLPKIKGHDDAKDAKWFTFEEVENMSDVLFEDHFSILKHMLARAR